MPRFHRQTILHQIGVGGQKKLSESKILIIGAGGLGHPVVQYLSAMGVGQIRIIDGDVVHISNLHRQILFTDSEIKKNKAEVLCQKMRSANPTLDISYENIFLDKAAALRLFPNFDVVVDCTDNFESKFLINDVCAFYDKPMVYGAISQFEGQVGIFWKSKGACYRCIYPDIPKSKIQNCAESGVVGPVVGIIGSLQALEVMKILINKNSKLSPLVGKVNYYNFCDHSFRSLEIKIRATCPCHSENYSCDTIQDTKAPDCQFRSNVLLVDVRERDEWAEFHIEQSLNLPLSEIENGLTLELKEDQEIVLICKAGARAKKAQEILLRMNFKNVRCSERSVYEY